MEKIPGIKYFGYKFAVLSHNFSEAINIVICMEVVPRRLMRSNLYHYRHFTSALVLILTEYQ